MPTASTAQILGNNESFEPYTQNLYVRRVLSGEFVQVTDRGNLKMEFRYVSFLNHHESSWIMEKYGKIIFEMIFGYFSMGLPGQLPINMGDVESRHWICPSVAFQGEPAFAEGPTCCLVLYRSWANKQLRKVGWLQLEIPKWSEEQTCYTAPVNFTGDQQKWQFFFPGWKSLATGGSHPPQPLDRWASREVDRAERQCAALGVAGRPEGTVQDRSLGLERCDISRRCKDRRSQDVTGLFLRIIRNQMRKANGRWIAIGHTMWAKQTDERSVFRAGLNGLRHRNHQLIQWTFWMPGMGDQAARGAWYGRGPGKIHWSIAVFEPRTYDLWEHLGLACKLATNIWKVVVWCHLTISNPPSWLLNHRFVIPVPSSARLVG